MKTIITNFSRKMWQLLMVLMVVGLTSAKASAATDLGALELGVEYPITAYNTAKGTFTAPKSGTLSVESFNGGVIIATDAEYENELNLEFVSYGPYTQKCEVNEGQTYYVLINFPMDSFTFKLTMEGMGEDPLEIIGIYPTENSYVDLASEAGKELQIIFNQAVQVQDQFIIVYPTVSGSPTKQATCTGAYASGKMVFAPIQAKILELLQLESGTSRMKENCTIEVVFPSLKTASGQIIEGWKSKDGKGAYPYFEFKVGTLPVTKTAEVVPSNFLSYWLPGSDEAKFEVTFSEAIAGKDVNPDMTLQILYGQKEVDDGYYVEDVRYTLEGNKLSADLSGMLRTPATMLPVKGFTMSNISIRLGNVKDQYGSPVYSGAQGSVGSFEWYLPYTILERANIACEFTPENGGSIKDLTEIKLWLNGLNTLVFDGFNFSFTENDEVQNYFVAKSAATFEAGDDNEGEFTITIPEACRNHKGVSVTLANLMSADGYDHSLDVKATYDDFVVTSCDPANGATMEWLTDGTVITIETNCSATYPNMYVIYEIEDLNPEDPDQAIIKTESWLNRQADGSYTAEVYGNYKMLLGHEYRVSFTAWESEMAKNYREESLGTSYIIWNGATIPYQYSPIAFVGITPEEGTKISADDREFTVTFDGYVTLDPATTFINVGQGMTQAFESIEALNAQVAEDGTQYSDTWVLTVPASYLATLTGALDISLKAIDQDGLLVKGTNGLEEQTYFYFSYDTTGRYAEFEVFFKDHAATAESVSELWVSNSIGIMPSYQYRASAAYVMSKDREIVARVANIIIPTDEIEMGDDYEEVINTELGLVLDTTIDVAGPYVLYVPETYFYIGTEFNQFNSAETYASFEISVAAGELPCAMTIDPTPGVVESLQLITIFFTDYDEVGVGAGHITLLKDGEAINETLEAGIDYDDWDNLNKLIIELPEEINLPGIYTFEVPAGHITLGADGIACPAFTLEYTIGEAGTLPHAMDITPAPGNVSSLSKIEFVFTEHEEISCGSGKIQLHHNGELKSEHPDVDLDNDQWNKATLDLGTEHTTPGEYKVVVPEGYFQLGADGNASKAFTLTYNITNTNGITDVTITTEEGTFKVYDINGRLRLDVKEGNINTLPAGLYIINGAKVLVK